MCGFFAGVFDRRHAPTAAQIEAALNAIAHRGPDGKHVERFDIGRDRVAILGHVRLALVGVGNGRQPFMSRRSACVVNGEFYDWRARRAELEKIGAEFETQSDSEIARAEYDAHGSEGWLETLHGEWAAALVDRETGELRAKVDRFGAKPLRWHVSADGRSCVVASEAKALFALGVPARLDADALRFALGLQYLPSGKTLFKDVGMLPPGCELVFEGPKENSGGRRGATIRAWADPFYQAESEAEAKLAAAPSPKEAIALLRASVRRRIPDEISFATHLSGGLDSALILALASEAAGPGIEAFTAAFEFGPNEVEQARETAERAGAKLVPVRMSARELLDAMDQAPIHSEGLSINAHAGAKIIIAQAVRSHGHKAVLTGEGADEAFWGYEHLRMDAGIALHGDAAANTAGVHRPEREAENLARISQRFGGAVPGFIRTKAGAAMSMSPAFGERLRAVPFDPVQMCDAMPAEWQAAIAKMDAGQIARGMWCVHGMSGYILRGLDDAMGMAHAVESRLAFLDHDLHRLAASAPAAAHFDANGLEKRLLRDGAHGLIPESVRKRRKAPFMSPSLTATPEGRIWARDRLLGGRLAQSGLFDQAGLQALLDQPDRPVKDAHLLTLASLDALLAHFELA